jgi:putative serine protease PepD
VTVADGRTTPFTVMAADPITDVGFVRWQRISALTPITLGTSGKASQYP